MANTNMTLSELIDSIKTEMQLDPGLISDTERKRFINDCIVDLGKLGGFEKTVELSVVNGDVELPDDLVDILAVYSHGVILNPCSYAQIGGVGYVAMCDTITVFPNDTDTIKLLYSYTPQKLVNLEDKPEIPNGYDGLIVDYAVAKANRKNGNIGIYREYMSAYEGKKYDLMSELTRRYNTRITNTINSEVNSVAKHTEEILF